jgi:hypothetical protein
MSARGIRMLQDSSAISMLREHLKQLPFVAGHTDSEHDESEALAVCLADLEEAFRAYLDDELPRLIGAKGAPEEMALILAEIGVNIQHILWHIDKTKYYAYLRGEDKRRDV